MKKSTKSSITIEVTFPAPPPKSSITITLQELTHTKTTARKPVSPTKPASSKPAPVATTPSAAPTSPAQIAASKPVIASKPVKAEVTTKPRPPVAPTRSRPKAKRPAELSAAKRAAAERVAAKRRAARLVEMQATRASTLLPPVGPVSPPAVDANIHRAPAAASFALSLVCSSSSQG